jgi:uncharacterized protein YjiS (DUF1127 family)
LTGAAKTGGNRPLVTLHDTNRQFRISRAATTKMESVMTKTLRRWRSDRRYRSTLRALRSLTARQLGELGIRPFEIQRLAREAARVS